MTDDTLEEFVEKDMENIVQLFQVFNDGTHGSAGKFESEMTERILKSSISTLEAFNDVRNNRSFAHDNDVLNYDESLLIFNHVTAAIRFLHSIENRRAENRGADLELSLSDEIPF